MQASEIKDIAQIVQAVVTVIAVFVGGLWSYRLFVKKRQIYPRAQLAHRITCLPLTQKEKLLNVVVTVSNIGDVLVTIASAKARIQHILPLESVFAEKLKKREDPVKKDYSMVEWLPLAEREPQWKDVKVEIEPGEKSDLEFDFIIDANVQIVRIYTFIRNTAKRRRVIGWNLATIYDVRSSKALP